MPHAKVDDLAGRRVFITGAASGIGRALARQAAAEGAVLFLTDRFAAGLDDAVTDIVGRGGTVGLHAPADIADHDQVAALARKCHERVDCMDIVMNVAGVSAWGTVDKLEHRQWRTMVEVNLMGPIHVIEHFVPPMISAGRGGHLVNVSSAAGLIGLPWHAAYSASKFGLRGVSEVLRFDLARHRIGVSLVCPGGVDTPLTETVEIAGVDKTGPAFQRLQERFRRRAVSPDQAARAILDGMKRGRYLIYTSSDIRLIHAVQRLCPPLYAFGMAAANRRATALLDRAGT